MSNLQKQAAAPLGSKILWFESLKKTAPLNQQIKKQEESPNTEYLFANLQTENTFDKSMRKMELVNSMDIFNTKN